MQNQELLEQCLKSTRLAQERSSSEYGALLYFGGLIGADSGLCLDIYDFYQSGRGQWGRSSLSWRSRDRYNCADAAGLSLARENGMVRLYAGENNLSLPLPDFFEFLGLVSDIYIPVLPLGSVVCIRKDVLPQSAQAVSGGDMGSQATPEKDIRLIITERFTVLPGTKLFFPYGGVLYPFGALAQNQTLQFGPQLIKETVFVGHYDADEKLFAERMREELLLRKGLHSMAFAIKEELRVVREAAETIMKGKAK